MNVLLVQPPDPTTPIRPLPLTASYSPLFAPCWEILCLHAFLKERTGHLASVLDCRLFSDLEHDLIKAIEAKPNTDMLVIKATSHALGQTAAVLAIAKRHFPQITTVLFGEFPSQFPEKVFSMSNIDFALAGDPEPVLRNLLDHIELPQRLKRTPGLIYPGAENPTRYWLPQLHSLSLPDWKDVFWSAYREDHIRAELRVSRGHTGQAADRAFGRGHEPLRLWPFDRVASTVQKCGHLGVSEIILTDPPGLWTPEHLAQWCSSLRHIRNRQPWVIRLLPTRITPEMAATLKTVACKRVEFIMPSCDPELLQRHGSALNTQLMIYTRKVLQDHEIEVQTHFWFGGPEEKEHEAQRVLRMLKELGYPSASLHSFPFAMHSMLYAELSETRPTPHLEDWINWSRDPWTVKRPLPLWNGPDSIPQFK